MSRENNTKILPCIHDDCRAPVRTIHEVARVICPACVQKGRMTFPQLEQQELLEVVVE